MANQLAKQIPKRANNINAILKCKNANGSDAVRNLDVGQAGAISKCIAGDGFCILMYLIVFHQRVRGF